MNPLSALDAISPAWNHTRSLLRPLRTRTFLKIALVALFTQFALGNSSYTGHRHLPGVPPAVNSALLAFGLFAALFGLLISFAFFYLNSRFQFVLFEVVLRRDTLIAPIWNRYGRATWYWMAIKFFFGVIAVICVAPFLILTVIRLFHIFSNFSNDGTPSLQSVLHVFAEILPLLVPIFIAAIVIGCFYRLLYDFGLPSMALEGTSIGETARRVLQLVRFEPGQVVLYILMHLLLGIVISIVYIIILLLVTAIAAIPLGGIGVGLWLAFRHVGMAGYIFMGLGWGILGLAFLAVFLFTVLALVAYILCFWQSYALYFLGGRYPRVGQYLEPLLPPSPPPYSTVPPPSGA